MKVESVGFGSLEIEGEVFNRDVVIEAGRVRKRRKAPSKPWRGEFGHTPLSTAEEIPWGGRLLIVGTGVSGALPIMPEVYAEAARRDVEIVAVPTPEACSLIRKLEPAAVFAILHSTC